MKKIISKLQPIGRALMLPIAVLPVAALLLRLGQPDLLNMPAIAAAGDAIFSNLGLLFAIGVAVGLARENHGAAGLAGVVGYLVATQGAKVLIDVPPEVTANIPEQFKALVSEAFRAKELSKLSVPVGLLSGLIAGWAYNRFGDIRLPSYLAFFGGRRFVPIVSGFAGLGLALVFGFGWQTLESGMDAVSQAVLGSEEIGLFAYGVLNRLLIVTGLHHIINNIAWLLLGDYNGVTGDLKRFFAGDPIRRRLHVRIFPGDDVRPAGRLPRHVPHRGAGATRGRRRPAALDGAHLVPHRRDRAHRVRVHVPRAGAVRHPCGAHRPRHGAHACARCAPGLRLLGGPVRLRAQLLAVDAAIDAAFPSGSATSRCTTACSATASCASI